jgi:hypothetical protein
VSGTNPFRFSTKYQDDETDLLYYGHRYLSVTRGGWPNRDPLEELGFALLTRGAQPSLDDFDPNFRESGGENLYAFVANDPITHYDLLGLVKTGDKFNVRCGGFLGIGAKSAGTLTIQAYNPVHVPGVKGGAEMKARFDEKNSCCCPGGNYQWIQTVTRDSSPKRPATPPYNDPQPPDDPLPYYWTSAENAIHSGPGWTEFIDYPSDPERNLYPNTRAKSIVVKFKTCLVCASSKDKELKCFSWGFKYYRKRDGTTAVKTL